MKIELVTLFPEALAAFVDMGVTGRAIRRGIVEVATRNPRDFCTDAHRTVDDRPYGGGPGMVMMVGPLEAAVAAAKDNAPAGAPVVMMSPQGRRFDQALARRAVGWPGLVLVAGRYEGVDERFIDALVDEEWSLGDFVLSGGELAALAVMDTLIRLLPGALGDPESALQDSFAEGLLDHPHYTRPEVYAGARVPAVLLSGDHEAVRRWRLKQALGRTWLRRPDLLERRALSGEEAELLAEYRDEAGGAEPDDDD